MATFNGWYYSWAPTIAYTAASNPWLVGALRVGLVPLFGILYASYFSYMAVAPLSPELGAITAGAVAAALIGLVYVAPIAWISARTLRLHRRLLGLKRFSAIPGVAWIATSGLMIGVAYLSGSALLMGIGTASLALSTLSLGSVFGALAIASVKLPILSLPAIALAARRFMRVFP